MDINEYPETLELIRDLSTPDTREWCEYAWQVLAEAGSVPLELEEPAHESHVEHIITMAALSTLAEWFNDDYDLSDYEPYCDIFSSNLKVSNFSLGIYVERQGLESCDSGGYHCAETAAVSAIRDRTQEIAGELVKILGESTVFVSLWSTQQDPSISLPPSDEDLNAVLNDDIDSEKGYRFERFRQL